MEPVATIKPQVIGDDVLSGCPVVLVDDTGYTVDDPRACVGSIVVMTPLRAAVVTITEPRGK